MLIKLPPKPLFLKIAAVVLFLFYTSNESKGQGTRYMDTLVLNEINDQSLAEYYVYYLSERDAVLSPSYADSLFRTGFFKKWVRPHNPFNPGVSGKDVWFRLIAKNTLSNPTTFF